MKIQEFFDPMTFTLTYLVFDEVTKDAIVIDPVLDYDPQGSILSTRSVDKVKEYVNSRELKVHYILETHVHADHLSSAQILKQEWPWVLTAIHENIKMVQETFKGVFNFDSSFDTKGTAFDKLLVDGEQLIAGSIELKVIHTPGHTPACVSYLFGNEILFTGDALFMPDYGTGRCDFPKGSSEDLYNSVHGKLYKLPDETRVYVGHDYQPGGRELQFKTTIGESKTGNVQLRGNTLEDDFIKFRNERDRTLKAPRLLLPSIQVNAQNGRLPSPEDNGVSYLKIPIRN